MTQDVSLVGLQNEVIQNGVTMLTVAKSVQRGQPCLRMAGRRANEDRATTRK
jgi:hypothetical protein